MSAITRLSCLTASQTLFLWMFLASDPLEQLAASGQLASPDRTDSLAVAMQFAAAWRHGMAGNSLLYMPGFFLTAATMWVLAAEESWIRVALQGAAAAAIALLLATLLAPWGAQAIVEMFATQHNLRVPAAVPSPSLSASGVGCYTLLTWSVFVLCARASLIRRNGASVIDPCCSHRRSGPRAAVDC
jgi:hypothetical protein